MVEIHYAIIVFPQLTKSIAGSNAINLGFLFCEQRARFYDANKD